MPIKSPRLSLGWIPSPLGGMSLLQQGFVDSIITFLSHDTSSGGRHTFAGYTTAQAGYIPSSRNMLVEVFLDKTDGDWLLMLDWDITFTPDQVYALLDYAGKDEMKVVSGVYLTYFGDDNLLRPCWFAKSGEEDYIPVTNFETNKVMSLTVCGMGFTIMSRKLLEKMRKEYKDDPWKWFGHDIIGASHVGEDLTFCSRARKVGATIWGHGGVLLGHTKAKTLRAEDMQDTQFARAQNPILDRSVLNVGGGRDSLPAQFEGWRRVSLDINPDVSPDIVADARKMDVKDRFDVVYCSHNIEHYVKKDVPKVLKNMGKVLKDNGMLEIHTPDLDEINKKLADGAKETDIAYTSPVGPITYYDMLNGFQKEVKAGNKYMQHHTMFTKQSLKEALKKAGFKHVHIKQENWELAAIAVK